MNWGNRYRYEEIRTHRINIVMNKEIRTSNHLTAGDKLDHNSDLVFDLKDKDDKIICADLSQYLLPDFGALRIRNAEKDLLIAKKFLRNSFPNKVQVLFVNSGDQSSTIDDILKTLIKVSIYIQREIWIVNYKMSSAHFVKLMNSFAHGEQIVFYGGEISGIEEDELAFKKKIDYKYDQLAFLHCGSSITDDSFASLVFAMQKTKMAETLKAIYVHDGHGNIERIQEQAYGMNLAAQVIDTHQVFELDPFSPRKTLFGFD